MNSPSELVDAPRSRSVTPYEFRLLTDEDVELKGASLESQGGRPAGQRSNSQDAESYSPGFAGEGRSASGGLDRLGQEAALTKAADAARREGLLHGEQEGRRAARAEVDTEMRLSMDRERGRLLAAVEQFRGARERYFAEVEQEVVKLALAIAARVLHREAQIDPLLLSGVVRVALEKMADRSGVVLRVAGPDVESWERTFHAMEASQRPRVSEDTRLERGECVLETCMGTVQLGVSVQLEEIEKGFFDLLNHRPAE